MTSTAAELPMSVEALTVRWSGPGIVEVWEPREGVWLTVTRPRVVSTVAELDALPVGTVLWCEDRSFERGGDFWGQTAYYACGSEMPYKPEEVIPAIVLRVGGTE